MSSAANGAGVAGSTSPSGSRAPLAGIRVLDLTQFLSGPYCTMLLADLGAEVIKLESPDGDLARHIPPHFVGDDSVYYHSINRNKRSVVLDMKQPDGIALARQLCLAADVVIENFRPGVLDRLGLNGRQLRAEKPGLVWCCISGFGQDGPAAKKPAYDMIVQAMSGGMSLTGEPGRGAVRAGVPIGDLCAGMYAAIAVTAALHARQHSGVGEFLDISMLDCQAAMLCYQAAYHLHAGTVPGRQGAGHDSIPTYRSFTASDDAEVVVCANTERMWAGLCRALGVPALTDEPRFATNAQRYEHRHALWPLLEAAFAKRRAAEWIPLLEAEQVPCGLVATLDQVVGDPQIQHRQMVDDVADSEGRHVRFMSSALKHAVTDPPAPTFPPKLGEHTASVLHDLLGLDPARIEALRAAGITRPQR